MAIIYKNQGFSLVTTGTTVLTIGASSRAIVKNIAVTNNHNNAVQIEMGLRDSSASTTYEFALRPRIVNVMLNVNAKLISDMASRTYVTANTSVVLGLNYGRRFKN